MAREVVKLPDGDLFKKSLRHRDSAKRCLLNMHPFAGAVKHCEAHSSEAKQGTCQTNALTEITLLGSSGMSSDTSSSKKAGKCSGLCHALYF